MAKFRKFRKLLNAPICDCTDHKPTSLKTLIRAVASCKKCGAPCAFSCPAEQKLKEAIHGVWDSLPLDFQQTIREILN
ncbi:hypothetical protein KJ885_00895 [Patescibacteria group bacterium]|nr:hypothetical protein [Patescibacteria group bacterium]